MTNRELQALNRRAARLKPKPVMLASGTWRCQTTINGKHISATGETPEEAHQNLLLLKIGKQNGPHITVGAAIDRYIMSKDTVLSPSTIAGYQKIRRSYFQEIMDVFIEHLTKETVQKSVNTLAKSVSPKTVRNAYGLLTASLNVYGISFNVTLPPKKKQEIQIPSTEEVKILLSAAKGTALELPILLAAEMGLRTSEIRGLTWDCIKDGKLHVCQAVVDGKDGPELKGTKSYSGDRWLTITPHVSAVLEKWKKEGRPAIPNQHHTVRHALALPDQICPETAYSIYGRFTRLCESCNLPHYRFHDLRHYYASVLLALGIPDKYAMERMGHATNSMLKAVYQHTMKDAEESIEAEITVYFSSLE